MLFTEYMQSIKKTFYGLPDVSFMLGLSQLLKKALDKIQIEFTEGGRLTKHCCSSHFDFGLYQQVNLKINRKK